MKNRCCPNRYFRYNCHRRCRLRCRGRHLVAVAVAFVCCHYCRCVAIVLTVARCLHRRCRRCRCRCRCRLRELHQTRPQADPSQGLTKPLRHQTPSIPLPDANRVLSDLYKDLTKPVLDPDSGRTRHQTLPEPPNPRKDHTTRCHTRPIPGPVSCLSSIKSLSLATIPQGLSQRDLSGRSPPGDAWEYLHGDPPVGSPEGIPRGIYQLCLPFG